MTAHDPLCRYRWNTRAEYGACDCAVITSARADERERIARAIEAEHVLRKSHEVWWSTEVAAALDEAILIARDGAAR